MPSVSKAQHNAMEAAAHGHSTLGIPKKVGEEFVAADANNGTAAGIIYVAPDGDILLLRRASTEENYAGHWALPGGKADEGETAQDAAARESHEEIGIKPERLRLIDSKVTPNKMAYHTFAAPAQDKFVPTLNNEHSGYCWASMDMLPQPLHPSVRDTIATRIMNDVPAADMKPEDWDGLRSGFVKWTLEEEDESEHAEDSEFEESKHPRKKNGEFGAGGKGSLQKGESPVSIPVASPSELEKIRNSVGAASKKYKPTPRTLEISRLTATQPGVFKDISDKMKGVSEKDLGLPLVYHMDGKFFIEDGHHRVERKIKDGEKRMKVNVLGLDESEHAEDSEFEENKHPRKENGEFDNGTSTSSYDLSDEVDSELFLDNTISHPLSSREEKAISDYTENDYLDLNKELRAEKTLDPGQISQKAKSKIETLDGIFNRASTPIPIVVYRQVDEKTFDKIASSKEYSDPAYMSSTANKEKLKGKNLVEIHLPKGSKAIPVGHLSEYGTTEQEILIARSQKFKVEKTSNGITLVLDKNHAADMAMDWSGRVALSTKGTSGLAFDKDTVRNYDVDGRLHVERSNISKANVCEYFGSEIPDYLSLGLDPLKKYKLLRDPEELKKAAPTFAKLPILSRHVPVSADDHQPDLVIGSTGSEPVFEHPYLSNDLVFWAGNAIDDIEANTKKELSSAYRYRADMTPGTFEGEAYDGVMRDIIGNHVALVKEGRAGPDVVVGDSKENDMPKQVLTRKAILLKGVATAALMPKLATDAKIDIAPLFAGVNAKNAKAKLPTIFSGIKTATKGKLAQDATLDDVLPMLEKAEQMEEVEGVDIDPSSGMPMAALPEAEATDEDDDIIDQIIALLGDKLGADDIESIKGLKKPAEDSEEAPEGKEVSMKKAEDDAIEGKKPDMVAKPAMDAAIAKATKTARTDALATFNAIREAERDVRKYVGDLNMSFDSAEGVYRSTLDALGVEVEGANTLPLPALKAILAAQPVPGAKPAAVVNMARDAKAADDFATRFPGAERIRNV